MSVWDKNLVISIAAGLLIIGSFYMVGKIPKEPTYSLIAIEPDGDMFVLDYNMSVEDCVDRMQDWKKLDHVKLTCWRAP